jgi:hypothetical protein
VIAYDTGDFEMISGTDLECIVIADSNEADDESADDDFVEEQNPKRKKRTGSAPPAASFARCASSPPAPQPRKFCKLKPELVDPTPADVVELFNDPNFRVEARCAGKDDIRRMYDAWKLLFPDDDQPCRRDLINLAK